jgi:hypothetical protein
MIRLIGTRWKRSNAWSQGVLIGRISCKECCTSPKTGKMNELLCRAQSKIAGLRVPLVLFSLALRVLHSFRLFWKKREEAEQF